MAERGAPAHSLVGSTFAGKYRVVQHLRSGGIAHVYLAEMLTLRPAPPSVAASGGEGRDVSRVVAEGARRSGAVSAGRAARLALKVLREELSPEAAMIRRFERGALAAAGIDHPNVVRVGPLERLPGGAPYCTMELLIGLDLADTLAYSGRMEPARAVRIAEGAAAGLAAAHAAGVVHLDVKPENVFLVHQPDGREFVKILDFGLASVPGEPAGASRVDAACSTPEYMAPEQRRGVSPSAAMDVYALGVVLHEMLVGHPPGGASGVRSSSPVGRDSFSAEALADVPPVLGLVLERALARDPAERFGSMEELRAALLAAAAGPTRPRASAGGVP